MVQIGYINIFHTESIAKEIIKYKELLHGKSKSSGCHRRE